MEQSFEFNLAVDGAPNIVKAVPYHFNTDVRYTVTINGGDEVIFAFDPNLGRYAPIGDNALDVPDNVEIAIGDKLNSNSINV